MHHPAEALSVLNRAPAPNWPPAELLTARLCLRKPRPADAPALFAHLSGDPQVTRYLGWLTHTALTQCRQQISLDLLRWDRAAAWTWVIEHAAQAAGLVQLTATAPHSLRLGCMLAHSRWGRGLMREGLHALMTEAFARPSLYRIEALCDVDNQASIRLMEKLGMRQEGRLSRYILHPNVSAEPRDVLLFALTREEAHTPPVPRQHTSAQPDRMPLNAPP